jgi:predicted flap endonuclease-1-like 5' DNA nuclease
LFTFTKVFVPQLFIQPFFNLYKKHMTSISIAVFIMMLIAAGFGFSIAWVFKNNKVQIFLKDFQRQKLLVSQLKEEQESLVQHSNNLQAETLKISQKNEKQAKRVQSLKDVTQQLENDKDFIFKEYEQFRQEVKSKLDKSQKLMDALEETKEKNQKLKIKADKWKIKLHEMQKQLAEIEVSYLKVKKEKELILEKLSSPDFASEDMLEWETNYKELKLKFLALTQEKKDIEQQLAKTNSPKNGDTADTLSRLSEELVILKRENKALLDELEEKENQPRSTNEKEDLLARIKSRSKQVDFGRIGKADARSTDDLKKLKGLGALIEQKFHAIGINTFHQLANFNEYDQKLFNFFLELPLGKIESEKWVSQAIVITGKEEVSDKTLKRISNAIEKINFDTIGEASPAQKDNLQSVVGIGPYIEQKLNAIGIFRLEQLARLSNEDIDEINGIMALTPGHIQSDDWVGQARRMK